MKHSADANAVWFVVQQPDTALILVLSLPQTKEENTRTGRKAREELWRASAVLSLITMRCVADLYQALISDPVLVPPQTAYLPDHVDQRMP